ncbi:hypothetical protein D6789_00050 [Candidatus Woesearchaeota archaeon]|nr:MAG: hypothetical protein D6789_00050 [Candidatus Woesearchaeota archaeon]
MPGVVTTQVDELIEFLRGKDKVAVEDVQKAIKVNAATLQSWIDFLVEEGILGIEYKFTKPFVYLNDPQAQKKNVVITRDEVLSWDAYHEVFLKKAREKHIPDLKAAALWKSHVLALIEAKKNFFYDEARKRELADIDKLWNDYKQEVLMKI